MNAVVILNAASGPQGPAQTREMTRRVADAFRQERVSAEVEAVEGAGLAAAVRSAAASRVDAVVVGGGDGSLSTAAAILAGGDTPLGVLPLGTLNHFAKDLGIPPTLEEAVRTIAQGHVRAVDVGEVNGQVFINNSSIGLYPRAVEERDERQARFGWSKWPAMLYATLKVVSRFRLLRLRLRVNADVMHLTTPFLFVGNNQYEMSLFSMGARSCLDRGELSLYIARPAGRLGLLRLALHALVGRLDQASEFQSMCLPELEIEARRHSLRVARDGEVTRMRPPLRYTVRPRALRVLTPPIAR